MLRIIPPQPQVSLTRVIQASDWEFKNRALVFGLIFAIASPLYSVDRQNVAAALANWLGASFEAEPDSIAHFLFALATLLVVVAAFIRTWASSYLHASVVYAAAVKTESLVADGPYRLVRNPLYFADLGCSWKLRHYSEFPGVSCDPRSERDLVLGVLETASEEVNLRA